MIEFTELKPVRRSPRAGTRLTLAITIIISAALILVYSGCSTDQPLPVETVDGQRISNANSEPGNWLTHGRDYAEQRFSPLTAINDENVAQLGLAWFADTGGNRGHEATPLVADGKMFISAPWSTVLALDAATGELIWRFDPEVPREWGRNACCDVVNRGVALWKGKIYIGTIDGRLIALDANTGKPIWGVTPIDRTKPYTITGAPRVVKGNVIIGREEELLNHLLRVT